MMMKSGIGIELHVPDFTAARTFYTVLGFRAVRAERRKNGYLVMKRGACVLNFYGGTTAVAGHSYFKQFARNTPRGYGVEIILPVEDIRGFYERVSRRVTVVSPLRLRRWGLMDFRIVDPFGFYIRCTARRPTL